MDLGTFTTQSIAQGTVSKYSATGNPWKDGGFLGECVSEVNQYSWRVLDVPAGAWGNAAWWGDPRNAAVQKYFSIVKDLKAGDILVYPTSFGGGNGHIEIYIGNNQSLGQNRHYDGRVRVESILPGYYAILRSKSSKGENEVVTNESCYDAFNGILMRPPTQGDLNTYVGKWTIDSLISVLNSGKLSERAEVLKAYNTGKTALHDDWYNQIKTLEKELAQKQGIVTELKPGTYLVK